MPSVDIKKIVTPDGTVCNLRDSQCPDVSEAIEAILDGVPNAPIVGTVTGVGSTQISDDICYQFGNTVFIYFRTKQRKSGAFAKITGINLPTQTTDGYKTLGIYTDSYNYSTSYSVMSITIDSKNQISLTSSGGQSSSSWQSCIACITVQPAAS